MMFVHARICYLWYYLPMKLISLFLVRILKNLKALLYREMKRVQVWLEDNQLTLNLKKTNYIIFKSHRKKYAKELEIMLIRMNMKEKKVSNTLFLGVMIDKLLTWKSHINYVTRKIAKTARILCKSCHFIKKDLLYIKSVWLIDVPHLIYGNIIWGNNYKTRLDSLITKMQNKLK